ncbi:MAG: tandem-95 repeat protein [gamma proteobacterium endosymbiont of Lamellibrachia anaximandri]|nr:tandem-95 repeat protein [gamma proteobacterium endosymbiont of Lamellibrachia anaximandri]
MSSQQTRKRSPLLFRAILLVASMALVLSGCGGGGGDDADPAPAPRGVGGGGVKGPLANAVATATLFDASQPGFKGTVVDTGTTDSAAAIQGLALPFPLTPPYILEFTSNAGTTDITTGAFPVISTMRTVITQALLDKGEQIYATPLTTMATDLAVMNADSSTAPFTGNGDGVTTAAEFIAALPIAAAQVASTVGFGMSGDIDIFDTPPLVDSTTDTTEEQADVASYRAAVEALTAVVAQIDDQLPDADANAVLEELAADLSTGQIDGQVPDETGTPTASTVLTETSATVLQQDPATLPIPGTDDGTGTPLTVDQVQQILIDEKATTGSTTNTDDLDPTTGTIELVLEPAEPDPDRDGDEVPNTLDAFPDDATESVDSDGDGTGDNADTDDDNDGVADLDDDFPFDPAEQVDTDGDGTGNNADTDDDGDGVPDTSDDYPLDNTKSSINDQDNDGWDALYDPDDNDDTNPGVSFASQDPDGDGIPNDVDADDDNDAEPDASDAFPKDASETVDTDGDGIGDNADADDDNDGLSDVDEGDGAVDTDGDGTPDSRDIDSDGDGYLDSVDLDPTDPTITVNSAPAASNGTLTTAEATVGTGTLTGSDVNAGDVLAFSVVSQGTSGTVAITDAVAGTYTYTPTDNDFNGTDAFTFRVSDGTASSNVATVAVTVTPVNDAPTADDDAGATDEGGSVTVNVLDGDADVEGDALSVTNLSVPANGTATLNADGSVTYTHDGGETISDSFTYTANDGTDDSAPATVNITVTPVNDAPIGVADSGATLEGGTVTIDLLANDSDAEGDPLTISGMTLPVNGQLLDNGDGTVTYIHNGGETVGDSFTYRANDGNLTSELTTVTITITPVNDLPTADDDAGTTAEGGSVTVNVLDGDTDAEGSALTVTNLSVPTNGTAALNADGTVTYTHDGSETISDSFTYTANDGTADSAVATVNITITPVNDVPVAGADSGTLDEGGSVTIDLLANDSDEENDPLSVTGMTLPAHGQLLDNGDGTITYNHDDGESTSDSFTYTAFDGTDASAVTTVTLTINPVNDAPVANDDSFSVGFNSSNNPLDVLVNDTDAEGSALTINTPLGATSHGGTVSTDGNTITYTPADGFNGTETFTYSMTDGTANSADATVTVIVSDNQAPVITEGVSTAVTMDEDSTPTPFSLTLNATDVEGDVLTWSVDTQATNGVATASGTGNSMVVTYVPTANFNGADSFVVAVTDGINSDTIIVNVTVTAQPDAPEITEGATTTVNMDEDGVPTAFALTLNATDADGDVLTWSISSAATKGVATASGTGASKVIGYTPNADANGTDTFTVQVDDGTGNPDTIDVTVNIAPVNDAPTIGGTALDGEVGVAYSFTPTSDDTEGDTLTFTATNLPSWASINGTTGEISGTPDVAGVQIDITITVTDDGTPSESADLGPFSITINPAAAVDDLSGVYKLTETTTAINRTTQSGTGTCYENDLVGDVERMYITVDQTGINLIAMSADPFGGQPTGTVDSANDTFTLALSESYSENGWDFTESFILTDGTYDLVAGTFSGTITETETGVDTSNAVNNYDCTRTTNLTADFVYLHNGTEDYNGVYGIEYRGSDNIQAGDQDRGTIPVEIVIDGNNFMPFVAGAHPNTVYSDMSFDPSTGLFVFTESFYDLDDLDGDGIVDDIQCSSTMIGGIFVRAPDDASGLPIISLSAEGTDKEFNDQVNPAVCSDPGAIPDWSDDSWTEMYGKRLTTEDYTLRVTSAVSDSGIEDLHIMGLLNPPLRTAAADSMLRAEVYDATGTVLLCSRAYDQGGFRFVSRLPYADFDAEGFQDGFYSFASCDTNQNGVGTPLVDGESYVVKIMDDMGTAIGGDDQVVVSHNATAQLALPVADRISRRDLDLNGVVSSSTERGRVIGLYGFFNPYQAMTASFPGVTGADGYHFDFDSTESPERRRVSSSSPTVTIPAGVINEWDGPSELRVWSVHDDGPRRAISWSRRLSVWAGMNGFFTVETDNLDLALGKFALQVISDGSDVTCVIPTFTGLSCHPSTPGASEFNPNAIDWANNRVSLTLYDLENGGVPIPTALTFTDSGNATVTMGTSTGVARAVNPELMVRSQLTEGGTEKTVISFGNAPAAFRNADVSLLDGNFDGEGDSFALWDDVPTGDGNDYMDVVDAYFQFPFDDGKAQRVGSYASTRDHSISVEDTVTATFTNDRLGLGLPPMTFSLDYTVPDPTAVAVPVRADITIHLDDGTSFTGNTATSMASAHDIGTAAIESVTWTSTLPADTLWLVRGRLSDPVTGNAIQYGELRSEPMDQATSADLAYDAGTNTWTWTAPAGIDLSLDLDELARLDLRTMDPARTMQGDTRSIYITSSTGGDGGGAVFTPDSSGSTSGTVTLSGTDTAIFGTQLDTGFVGAFLATAVQPDYIVIVDSSSTLEFTADINNGFTIVVTDDSPESGMKFISMAIVKDGIKYDYTCTTPNPVSATWTIDCGGVNSINLDIGNRTVIFSNTLVSNQDTGAILTIDGTLTW